MPDTRGGATHRALRRSVGRELALTAFFLALALVQTRPLWRDLRGQTLAGLDPTIDLWTVSWLVRHFFQPHSIFGGNVFFPCPHAVLLSDLSMGTVVLLLPLRALLRDPVLLYNAGLLIALTFGGWAFSRLVGTLRGDGDALAGLVAGTAAAFGNNQMTHVYHLNLLTIGWIALMLLGLHQLASHPRWGHGLLIGVSFALCAMSSGYYGVAAAILAVAFGLSHLRRLATRQAAGVLILATAVAVLSLLPYMVAFARVREDANLHRSVRLSEVMAFHPSSDMTSRTYAYRRLLGSGGEPLFPGVVTPALAAIAVARRRPQALFYAGAAGLLVIFSLGPHLSFGGHSVPLPYEWLFAVPPFDAMRHPYTFAAVATMLLALLAGLAVPAAATRPRWLAPLLLSAVLAELLVPPVAVREVPPGVPPAYELLKTLPPGPALEIPLLFGDSMIWAARHGLPVTNGNGAFAPPAHQLLHHRIENHWLTGPLVNIDKSRPMPLLERLDVRYLVVPADPRMGRLAAALSTSRRFRLLKTASDGALVFERQPDAPAPGVP